MSNDNRLAKSFAALRASGKRTMVPFLTAGFPDLKTTGALLAEIEARGVAVCEIGFPFSDSIADGPTIQSSYYHALEGGVTCEGIFEMVKAYRKGGGKMALVAMVSDSIVYRRGYEGFSAAAAEAGFDALLIPDLPLEEALKVQPVAASHGLCCIMLVAPTSTAERREQIARSSTGFVYYMSVAGITGARTALPAATLAAVAELKTKTDTPICVGFGISSPEMVSEVCKAADGAIVGSAIVAQIAKRTADHPQTLVKDIGNFVAELLAGAAGAR
ncbi:MAG: tryptophan synthase subunit alpha [Planctomycetaceae bacterium]|nr:tryptophan synthase subunit alpha [Planctomycetaceae bacterium]